MPYEGKSTDGIGALKALNLDLHGKKVVLIGAGGAAYAIGAEVVQSGGELVVVNRTFERGRLLAKELKGSAVALKDFSKIKNYDVFNSEYFCREWRMRLLL